MDELKIMLCVSPAEATEAAQTALTLCHMAYRIGDGFRLFRSGIGARVRGGLLFLTDYALDPSAEYASVLIRDIVRECDARGYSGLVCDFENSESERLRRFIYEAATTLGSYSLTLYVPAAYADIAPSAHVLVGSSVAGGSFQEHLTRSVYKYTPERAALFYEPMCIDFVMPMPAGENDRITRAELDARIREQKAISYYSRELGAYYFTYRDAEKRSRFVLFDDERSMLKKLTAARQAGYREAFILYADAKGSLDDLKKI